LNVKSLPAVMGLEAEPPRPSLTVSVTSPLVCTTLRVKVAVPLPAIVRLLGVIVADCPWKVTLAATVRESPSASSTSTAIW
jgi:hypothetical protein